jgi:uncharacterized protein YggE
MTSLGRNRISRHEARSWVALAAFAGLVLGVFAGPVLAADPTPAPNGNEPAEHTISVTGTGSVFVKPDVADVSLGVVLQRPHLREARDAAAERMNAILAALRALDIADADIRTATLDISPVYDYMSGSPTVTGYQVTNIVAVHVRDLEKLSSVIDDSVSAGATTVSGITFDLADRAAAERQAREAAVRDARARADTLAGAAGVTISGVASISETYTAPWPWYGDGRNLAPGESPTPVVPGESEITISVAIVYLIG